MRTYPWRHLYWAAERHRRPKPYVHVFTPSGWTDGTAAMSADNPVFDKFRAGMLQDSGASDYKYHVIRYDKATAGSYVVLRDKGAITHYGDEELEEGDVVADILNETRVRLNATAVLSSQEWYRRSVKQPEWASPTYMGFRFLKPYWCLIPTPSYLRWDVGERQVVVTSKDDNKPLAIIPASKDLWTENLQVLSGSASSNQLLPPDISPASEDPLTDTFQALSG